MAAHVEALIANIRSGTSAEHVGSTAVQGLIGKNVVDLQITADPADSLHCHVVPATGRSSYKAGPPGPSAGTAPHPGRTGPYARRIGGRDCHGVARLPTRLLPSISLQSRNL